MLNYQADQPIESYYNFAVRREEVLAQIGRFLERHLAPAGAVGGEGT
jgi:hypothetical protein